MPYIGKTPTVGNFQVCDAISVVNGQAAYTLQVGGVNVAPESANHMLVSLNGILQKPGSSFTISGSTMTFASNLATGDVIDFVQILGNVLDIGQPSDDTVTAAKLATTSITGQTAETSAADADTILIHDDSAGALRKMTRANFVSGVGGDNTPAFSARVGSNQSLSDNTDTKVNFDTEDFDTDSAYDTTNKRFTVPTGEGGKYFFYARGRFLQNNMSQYVIAFRVNGSEVAKRYIYSGGVSTYIYNGIQYRSYDISAIETLSAGDYIEVYVKGDNVDGNTVTFENGTIQSEFSGFKLIGV